MRLVLAAAALTLVSCVGLIEEPVTSHFLPPPPPSDTAGVVGEVGPTDAAVADAGVVSPPYDAGVVVAPPDAGPLTPSGCLKVMPLGDSITLGVNGGYRNNLYTGLADAGCGVNYVGSQVDPYAVCIDKNHEGHPGFTIGDIATHVDGWLASAQPDYVLLMVGTNDVAWWSADTGAQIADRHAQLVDRIFADRPGVWIIVASIPPLASNVIAPNSVDRAQLGRDLNAAIKTRVDARIAAGKRIRFADVYASLVVADLYDGVHPTQVAHAKVAEVWRKALLPITVCVPNLVCGP